MTTITLNTKDAKELFKTGSLMINKRLLTYDNETEYNYYYNEEITEKEIVRVLIQNGIKHPRVEVSA